MTAGDVAVIITNYRCQRWLPRAIGSILAQTYPPVRIIVVDDSSGDPDTFQCVLRQFADSQIEWMATTRNIGQFRIYNHLLPAIGTKFVAFQDADDWSEPERIAALIGASSDRRLDIAGSHIQRTDERNVELSPLRPPEDVNQALRWRCRGGVIFGATTLCRADFLLSLGGFDGSTRFGADTDLTYRAVFAGRVGNVPRMLYHATVRHDSLSGDTATGFGSPARRDYRLRIRRRFYKNRLLSWCGALKPGHLLASPNNVEFKIIRSG